MGCGAHFINSKPEVLRAAFNAIPLGFECDKCGTLAEYVAEPLVPVDDPSPIIQPSRQTRRRLQRAAAKKLRGS